VRELHDLLGAKDAAVVWLEGQDAFRQHADDSHLDIVVDIGYREVILVTRPEDLGEAVRTSLPTRVAPVGACPSGSSGVPASARRGQ
jgi:hypothetical protein